MNSILHKISQYICTTMNVYTAKHVRCGHPDEMKVTVTGDNR